jgi:beta-lactamase regulating signal transducer with metallopeptidase domain
MNDIGLSLVAAAVQVTLVAIAALVLYALAARKGPGEGAGIAATGLSAGIVLTFVALIPLPEWWSWETPAPVSIVESDASPSGRSDNPTAAAVATGATAIDRAGLLLAFLRTFWLRMGNATLPEPARTWQWPTFLAAFILAGIAIALVRLMLALTAVARCRRRSLRIEDACLLAELERCRIALGCGPVEARESPDIGVPATMGCHRPIVLLPRDWRTWGKQELRVVLAHELAHVRRRDYLVGLLARLGVAVHFYHPLVHWLAARLRLQQELGADALGARYAGGPGSYLRALSQLALRQEVRPSEGLAASMLTASGTLMRRIQMLQNPHGSRARPLPRLGRAVMITALIVITIFVSALRTPAQTGRPGGHLVLDGDQQAPMVLDFAFPPIERYGKDQAGSLTRERFLAGGFRTVRGFAFRGAGQESQSEASRNAFDLSYLSPEAKGVWAIRPATILNRPEMKKHLGLIDGYIRMGIRLIQANAALDLSAADIDLLAGQMTISTNPKEKEHPSALMHSLTVVRAVKDFDWKKQVDKILPGAVEVACEGKSYYQLTADPALTNLLGIPSKDFRLYYCIPDGRTLVCDTDAMVRRILKREQLSRPLPIWSADWKHVERGLFAAAYGARDKKWLKDRKRIVRNANAPEEVLFENADSIVFGVDYGESFLFQAFVRCNSEEAAEKALEAIRALLGSDQKEHANTGPNKGKTIADRFLDELRAHTLLERQDKLVIWRSEAKISLADVMAAIPQEIRGEIQDRTK